MNLFDNIKNSITKLETDMNEKLNNIKGNVSSLIPFQTTNPAPTITPNPSITTISGCKSIHGIKNLNRNNMYALQALVMPGSQKGTLTAEQIITTCDSIITNALYIIDDCKKIISDTINPQVFYERYDLLIEKYKEISKFEPYVDLYGYQPNESLTYYVDAKSRFEKKMIDRCYNKALIKADSMKTEKGQMNQFIKANESLKAFARRMSPENIVYMDNKFRKKILS